MSLVSYGASDESDASDSEDGSVTTNQVQALMRKADADDDEPTMSGHISDEDDFQTVSSTSVTSSSTGGLLNTVNKSTVKGRISEDDVNSTSVTSLDDLPAPQSRSHSATAETEEEDLEDEVKPKASEIASAPKPPGKKAKQPVKITIPSLDETPEEDESESKKRAAPSTVKSGLFSMLPAPVHSARKEVNRPLIPHTLTKRPVPNKGAKSDNTGGKLPSSSLKSSSEAASTSDISSKRMTPFNALTGYDSDSDDETGSTTNFFSLNSSSEVKASDNTSVAASKRLQSEEVSSSESDLAASLKKVENEKSADSVEVSGENGNEEEEEEEAEEERNMGPEPGAVNDAPLDFRSMNRLSSWSGSSYGFLGPVGPAGPVPPSNAYTSYQSSYSVPSNSVYNMANAQMPDEMSDPDTEAVADDDLKKFMSDKEFQKLQGKRKRGLEEAINFVDANVDDYVDPSEVSKHLTEETEYVSHKNKDNLPTAQQRRKKQITYLAYQAKERELELKNTWAANRMTKKQTQSKYGF